MGNIGDGKWRYCRPVLDDKGKVVPNMVLVNGREVRHDEGTYVISFYNPTLTWQKCGPKPADAVAAAERQRALFKAMEHGIVERPKAAQPITRIVLRSCSSDNHQQPCCLLSTPRIGACVPVRSSAELPLPPSKGWLERLRRLRFLA
jgi:hypothetical protein